MKARNTSERPKAPGPNPGWRLVPAAALAAALLLWAPFVDVIRGGIRAAFPGQFRSIIEGGVAAAVAVALLAACIRIRERRALRFAALGASVLLGLLYARATGTGNADVDAVERFHFVEYGLLAFLLYRAWRPLNDGSMFILPFVAGILVGTLDEWVQWFIPVRVGEMHDVFLNGIALVCGLLFGVGFDPPQHFTFALGQHGRRHVTLAASLTFFVFGMFFHSVHLGYEIRDPEIGVFHSHYSAAGLMSNAIDRRQRWRDALPLVLHRLSREDQYFSEGVWHAQRRNVKLSVGDLVAAWRENRILEKFYEPVLDRSSYVAAEGLRWPAGQRADVQARAGASVDAYVSDANPLPIYAWSKLWFWTGVVLAIGLIGVVGLWPSRHSAAREETTRSGGTSVPAADSPAVASVSSDLP